MRTVTAAFALVAVSAAMIHAQAVAPRALVGPAPAAVFGLTAAGRLVGSVTPAGQSNAHAAFWRTAEAAPLELLPLPGTNWSRAFAVNARGQIVGLIQDRSVSPPVLYAAFWESESDAPVALGGGATTAVAINGAGIDLDTLVINDPLLRRIMVTVVVNPARIQGVNEAGALALQRYLLEPGTQANIRQFRHHGLLSQTWSPAGRNNAGSELMQFR